MASSSSSETLKGPSPSSPSNLSSVTLVGSPADPEKHQKQAEYSKPSEELTEKYAKVESKKETPYKQEFKSPELSKKERPQPEPSSHRHSEPYKPPEEYPRKDSYDPPEQSKPRLLMKREPDLLPTSPQHFQVRKLLFYYIDYIFLYII